MDYITAVCGSCNEQEFRPYSFSCDTQDARLHALGLALCGNVIACPSISSETTTLIGQQKFRVIHGVTGSKAAPTLNETDLSTYSCLPNRTVRDRDETLNFEAINQIENYEFWNQLANNESIVQQMFYVTKSGVQYEIPTAPTVTVYFGNSNDLDVVIGSATWTTKQLEKPTRALADVWKCQ